MRKATAIELDNAQREKLVLAQSNTTEVRSARPRQHRAHW